MMKTKIICSIGPETESDEKIQELIKNGMAIARLNFSHDKKEIHAKRIEKIRSYAKKLNKKVEILVDLQGPKIRIADFAGPPKKLEQDKKVVLTTSACQDINKNEIVIDDPYLHSDVLKNDVVLIDDGQIELVVERASYHKILCKVVRGGIIYPKKGVNVPLTMTTTASLTNKDKKDLSFILPHKPEWVGLSFVQTADDIVRLKKLINNKSIRVVSKIERALAIQNLEQILKVTDAIMVARGDLGVEIPIEQLPIVQKQIISLSNKNNIPVITATHMLASMTHASFPTRAEVSDIANAIFDGTNAVMLSNETTIGEYPIESIKIMSKVIKATEDFIAKSKKKPNAKVK